jgi:hypothetical protein
MSMEPLEEGEIALPTIPEMARQVVVPSISGLSDVSQSLSFYSTNAYSQENQKAQEGEAVPGETLSRELFRVQVTQELHVVGLPHPTKNGEVCIHF